MRQWSRLSLIQAMACRLIGAKPLTEPMLMNYEVDTRQHATKETKQTKQLYSFRKYIQNAVRICCLPRCVIQ